MSIEQDFFSNLSNRMYKENDLSDITWAMCNSSNQFKKEFIQFCFNKDISDMETFDREYVHEDCRSDFHITRKDSKESKEYLIEVKIYDKNNHFEQYEKSFPNAEKSFIVNYSIQDRKGWKIKQWKDFPNKLNSSGFPDDERNLVNGYISYLNSIINNIEVKQMNLSNISSLKDFYNSLTEIGKEITIVSLEEYKRSKSISEDYYGKYFYFNIKKNKPVYFWVGLYIPEPNIYFLIDHYTKESWCPSKEAEIIKNLKSGKYHDKTAIESDALWLPLKTEYYEKFCSDTKVDEQKEILKGFIEEIIGKIIEV